MAIQSRVNAGEADTRFFYEPMLSGYPVEEIRPFEFAGKTMKLPIWVSSMTGGTALAGQINRNLATVCAEFGMGMGLGSCRTLLESPKYLSDFDVREYIGSDAPLYANLGIAQLEKMLAKKETDKISDLVHKLRADGIIIHVNPLQEVFQPEGDLITLPPIETLTKYLELTKLKVIVKEVGQGMGPESLKLLLKLPLQAIEFGALGGTNFTKLELARHSPVYGASFNPFGYVGHSATEMTKMVNSIVKGSNEIKCKQIIISGGITNVLDGYYLINISTLPSVFGLGSAFLQHAMDDYENLRFFVEKLKKSLDVAGCYLKIKPPQFQE